MKKIITLLMALTMCAAIHAQEIEKLDKFPSGYINGVFMGEAKFKTVDGVLYAVGYEGTRDWILVRYPAGSRNESYTPGSSLPQGDLHPFHCQLHWRRCLRRLYLTHRYLLRRNGRRGFSYRCQECRDTPRQRCRRGGTLQSLWPPLYPFRQRCADHRLLRLYHAYRHRRLSTKKHLYL